MTYTCIACSDHTMGIFYRKEKALFHLFECSNSQKEIFIYSFISHELIERCLKFYAHDQLEILDNQIFYQNHWIKIYPYFIETDDIYTNILFDYMKRYYKNWCCKDSENHMIWIKACNIVENCVK